MFGLPVYTGIITAKLFCMKVDMHNLEATLHGKLGDLVYYRRNGQTFTRRAAGSYNKIPTSKQAPVRARFTAAVLFAKAVLADPALKALYVQKANGKCTAFSKAVSDYMRGTI